MGSGAPEVDIFVFIVTILPPLPRIPEHTITWEMLSYIVQGPIAYNFYQRKALGKSENSGKHEFTIDFTIGTKLWLK